MINKWIKLLSLDGWTITTERIDPGQVLYDTDCPSEDRYYVGISSVIKSKMAVIYHDRELTERDVIHELLHVRYPWWSEEHVNEVEQLLFKIKKDE